MPGNEAFIGTNYGAAPALRDAVYGLGEPVPYFGGMWRTKRKWTFLYGDFCGRTYMTSDEMVPLAHRFVSEVGPWLERTDVGDKARFRQFKAWLWTIVKQEGRDKRAMARRNTFFAAGGININTERRKLVALLRAKFPRKARLRHDPELSRVMYLRHRDHILAQKRREYWRDPEKERLRCRTRYRRKKAALA